MRSGRENGKNSDFKTACGLKEFKTVSVFRLCQFGIWPKEREPVKV